MPASLTSEQEVAIIHATKPLQVEERTAFMTALTAWLNDRAEVGDGELSRTLRDLQRKHFKPPDVHDRDVVDHYPRRRSGHGPLLLLEPAKGRR